MAARHPLPHWREGAVAAPPRIRLYLWGQAFAAATAQRHMGTVSHGNGQGPSPWLATSRHAFRQGSRLRLRLPLPSVGHFLWRAAVRAVHALPTERTP